jgi:hypothetical protein
MKKTEHPRNQSTIPVLAAFPINSVDLMHKSTALIQCTSSPRQAVPDHTGYADQQHLLSKCGWPRGPTAALFACQATSKKGASLGAVQPQPRAAKYIEPQESLRSSCVCIHWQSSMQCSMHGTVSTPSDMIFGVQKPCRSQRTRSAGQAHIKPIAQQTKDSDPTHIARHCTSLDMSDDSAAQHPIQHPAMPPRK